MTTTKSERRSFSEFRSDVIAGFSTGLFSIPEGMAYAQIAGVNPVYGLYSGMVATLTAALTTGTILMISTLTSAIAVATASVIDEAGLDSSDPNALFTITLVVGITMFILGILRLGSLVNYVSNAVMTGFVMGASALIIIGELGDFSGYDPVGDNDVAEVWDWITNINQWDRTTTLVGLTTVVIVLVLKRIRATEKMASIITLLAMSTVVYIADFEVELVGDIADIPSSLPTPMLPDFAVIPEVALGSISVALVALVQGAGISTAYPNPDGSRTSASRDFLGQGLGNMVGSFFQSMSTGGSLSRTGISVSGGAKSRWGGIFAAVWLALIILLFGGLAELVPLTVIAGLLFVIGAELIIARIPSLVLVHRVAIGSAVALWLTFISAFFIPLQFTIFLGAGLSLLLYISASSKELRVRRLVRNEEGRFEEQDVPDAYPSNATTIMSIGGPDFFAEVPTLEEELPESRDTSDAVVVFNVRGKGRSSANSTALRWIEKYAENLEAGSNQLMLAEVSDGLFEALEKTGVIETIGRDHVFHEGPVLGGAIDDALEAAAAWHAARPSGPPSDYPTTSSSDESADG